MNSERKFTDLFIQRPVLAIVISLLVLILGLRALVDLPVRQFPKVENTVIKITTVYPGASASLIEGFITTPIEKEVASADGIDYMTSTSTDNFSTINVYVRLNYNPNDAFTSVMSKVAEVRSQLPREADEPVIQKETGSSVALMYVGYNSDEMTGTQITDYLSRMVQPKLETIPGVAAAEILGANTFAMRIWLDSTRMAALGVTPEDVRDALLQNNFQAAAGSTKGKYVEMTVSAQTDVQTAQGFNDLIIKRGEKGELVRVRDVAQVELGSENYNSSVIFNGKRAVFIGITPAPEANPLTVINDVKKQLEILKNDYPNVLKAKVVYDATAYIRSSIKEVITTIAEAAIIVILVIFVFLGSLRTVTIPMVTIPLSLIGVCLFILILGYSINLLTLLAMVLAIGMVVDDAIVVVENIYRHIEEGIAPFDAAIQGAREIALPVISMTITLAAVYAPIGFMGGLTGALFKEFAFTLASAVIISGLIALTLSPMMCSRILTTQLSKQRLVHAIDQRFEQLKNSYRNKLHRSLDYRPVTILFALVVLISCLFLYLQSPNELAPNEDQGVLFSVGEAPEYGNINYTEKFSNEFNRIYQGIPAGEDYFIVNGFGGNVNQTFSGLILKPWDQRTQNQNQLMKPLQEQMNQIAGLQISVFPQPPLPTGGDYIPLQFVVTTIQPFDRLYEITEQLVEKARKSGLFLFIKSSLQFNKPESEVRINRRKAAQLGISMENIATALSVSLGENYVNRFPLFGRSYKVIPQLEQSFRINPDEIKLIHVKTFNGKLVPLSNVVDIQYKTVPNELTHFNQINAALLSGIMTPGQTLATGLTFLQDNAKKLFPQGYSYDYGGQSRELIFEGKTLAYTLFFSIIVIFLVLSAQFESFTHSLVILISVPMAICGALLVINWGFATINIFTQIGLITLIGLISKHGILMVEFANKLKLHENLSSREAIEKAAAIRLRPVLMTTFSMILGVVPLLLAFGAGAASRFDIGLTIAAGMLIGTLFTLFVIPTMYLLKSSQILLFLLTAFFLTFFIHFIFYS